MAQEQDLTPILRDWLREPDGLPPPRVAEMGPLVHQTAQQRGLVPPMPWRFQPMVSATKLTVAGVVVALFGGFLLAGVLTQPSDESMPAGASASASAEVRTDLLPGVDLVTEDVGPRLVRVINDGEHALSRNVADVAVADDGDVWVMKRDGRVMRLGERGAAFRDPLEEGFHRRSDGTLLARVRMRRDGDGDWVRLEDEGWVEDPQPGCLRDPDIPLYDRLIARHAPDGTCWHHESDLGSLARFDDSSQELEIDVPDGYPEIGRRIDFAPDGTVWVSLGRLGSIGLASYDGSAWTPFVTNAPDGFELDDMAVAPDGVVWMTLGSREGWMAMSWDGETWKTYEPDAGVPYAGAVEVLPDGSIWFGRVAELDGDTLRPIESLAPIAEENLAIESLANAPDGSVWIVVGRRQADHGGLYVITPLAMTASR